jgi:Linalool dehydratase/isomerase
MAHVNLRAPTAHNQNIHFGFPSVHDDHCNSNNILRQWVHRRAQCTRVFNSPPRLPFAIDTLEKLTAKQAGHIRHFHNLASHRFSNTWRCTPSKLLTQEWLDALCYQLATMAYAAGVAHYHRLPLARSIFKSLFEKLIAKMLRREVPGVHDYKHICR